ncbi:MAG: VOC family protein [Polaribacter sp.]
MHRKYFLKTIFGAFLFITMDTFSSTLNMLTETNKSENSKKFASYGAIHLKNTNLKKAITFWTKIVGMKLRKSTDTTAEFGSENNTLVVVHQTAKIGFQKGYSGLYHVAIHAPNKAEFASMTNRLIVNNYPFSPVDHTMSKSMYLDDPDGINIEFTLETPERFKRVITTNGLQIETADGTLKSASAYLDVQEVLKELVDKDVTKIIHSKTYIGHLHLYANNVEKSNEFYQKIGFNSFNNLPQFMYADLGAGGKYQHRIALNSWHGQNQPLAPIESAGMKSFQIIFNTKEKFNKALNNVENYQEKDGFYWIEDPTGNKITISHI